MLNDSALVRLLNPCRRRRGNGLGWTTGVTPRFGTQERNYGARGTRKGTMPHAALWLRPSGRAGRNCRGAAAVATARRYRLSTSEPYRFVNMTILQGHTTLMRRPATPLTHDGATIQ